MSQVLGLGLFLWGDRAVPLTGLAAGSDTGDRCLGSFAYLASGPPFWWAVSMPWTDCCALTDALGQAGGPGPTLQPPRGPAPRCALPGFAVLPLCPRSPGPAGLTPGPERPLDTARPSPEPISPSPARLPNPGAPQGALPPPPFHHRGPPRGTRLVGLECANAVLPSVLRLSGSCPTASMGRAQAR